MSGLREALVDIKTKLDERSEAGEAHLFLNIHYWDLEELLEAHPPLPAAADISAQVIREHEPRPMACSCGAKMGDGIDYRWHLVNQTVAAMQAAGGAS